MSMNFPFEHNQPDPNWSDSNRDEAVGDDNESSMTFDLAMSLALDELLDEDELAQFHADIEYYPLLANKWATWQELDGKMIAEPSIMPPVDFVQNFEKRLSKEQHRKKFWLGATVATVTVILWASIIIGTLSAGAYMAVNQSSWVTDQIQSVAYLLHGFTVWIQSTASALNIVVGTALVSPQMWGIVLAYSAFMGGILVFWTRFLRRSMNKMNASAA